MKNFLLACVLAFATTAVVAENKPDATTTVVAEPTKPETKSETKKITLSSSNTLFMSTYFYPKSTSRLMKTALELDGKLMPQAPIYLVLDSGGGSIQAGLEMVDFLSSFERPVHTISIWAASMGFQTVQGLDDRYLIRDGTLMSHKAWGVFWGEFPGQLDSRYQRYLKRVTEMNKRVVERTNGKYTLEQYEDLIENEYWCDGQDCVDAGFADAVVDAKCDSSLSGIRKEVFFRTLVRKNVGFGSSSGALDFHVVEFVDVYSKCPLITGYLDWNIYIDGKPVYNLSPDGEPENAKNLVRTGDPELDATIKKIIDDRYAQHKSYTDRKVVTEP